MTDDRSAFTEARAIGKAKHQEQRLTALQIMDALKRADGFRVGIGHQVHGYDAGCPVCQGSPSGIAEVLVAAGLALNPTEPTFIEARDAGLKQRHETREARAIRRQVAEEIAEAIEGADWETHTAVGSLHKHPRTALAEAARIAREIGSKETS